MFNYENLKKTRSVFGLFCMLLSTIVFAQDLYVADNSYMYVRDVPIHVTDDIRMETTTSNIFLRGDAQLTQDTDSKNSDAGSLSVFQEQTATVYNLNYMASPVGRTFDNAFQFNASSRAGVNFYDPNNELDLTDVTPTNYIFEPANIYDGTATSLAQYWLFTLRDGEGYNSWNQVLTGGSILAGYGFTIKGTPTAGNTIDFRGRPNNGNIRITCTFDGVDNEPAVGPANTAETLAGNPYPSSLDLKLFFVNSAMNQANTNGQLYFWEQLDTGSHFISQYDGGYGVYIPGDLGNLLDNGSYTVPAFRTYRNADASTIGASGNIGTDFGVNNSRRFAAIGQGFVVRSSAAGGGDVQFNNSMRMYMVEDSSPTGNGSVFGRTVSKKKASEKIKRPLAMSHNGVDYQSLLENKYIVPEIRIHTHIANEVYKENLIAFRPTTPNNYGYNKFYDAQNINPYPSDVYLMASDRELAVKSISYDERVTIPLGFKAEKDGTSFNVYSYSLQGVPDDVNVYVHDKDTNIYTDIRNGDFQITLDEGVYNERFEVAFLKVNNTVLSPNDPLSVKEDIKVYQNNKASELSVLNEAGIFIKNILMYDVSGKRVLESDINASNDKYDFSTSHLSDGVYVVKVGLSDDITYTKKVILKR